MLVGISLPACHSSPFPAYSSRQSGSLEARPPRMVWAVPWLPTSDSPMGRPAPLKLGSAPALVAAPLPLALQGCARLLCSWVWCQAGRRLEKGLFWQELQVLPVLGHPRGLAWQGASPCRARGPGGSLHPKYRPFST